MAQTTATTAVSTMTTASSALPIPSPSSALMRLSNWKANLSALSPRDLVLLPLRLLFRVEVVIFSHLERLIGTFFDRLVAFLGFGLEGGGADVADAGVDVGSVAAGMGAAVGADDGITTGGGGGGGGRTRLSDMLPRWPSVPSMPSIPRMGGFWTYSTSWWTWMCLAVVCLVLFWTPEAALELSADDPSYLPPTRASS